MVYIVYSKRRGGEIMDMENIDRQLRKAFVELEGAEMNLNQASDRVVSAQERIETVVKEVEEWQLKKGNSTV